MKRKHPRIAIVYDWLDTNLGGAERMLQVLLSIYPRADLVSLFQNQPSWINKETKVITSWLQYFPKFLRSRKLLSGLMPLAVESLDMSKYDLVISVSSSFAKGVITQPNQLHICYLLTPPRFLYSHQASYSKGWLKTIFKPLLRYWTFWDKHTIHRPDYIIPISKLVQDRVREIYQIETLPPIYPCFTPMGRKQENVELKNKLPNSYWLVVSRFADYKNIDLAIRLCSKFGTDLVIVGKDNKQNLEHLVTDKAKVVFLEEVSDSELVSVYAGAKGLLMLGIEDFGIVGLEAVAAGIPVVVNSKSGVAEVLNDKVSIAAKKIDLESLLPLLSKAEKLAPTRKDIQQVLDLVDIEDFKKTFLSTVDRLLLVSKKD